MSEKPDVITLHAGPSCGLRGCGSAAESKSEAAAVRTADSIEITMYSDFICPWCYLGFTALERLKGRYDFTLTHKGYKFLPDLPEEGEDVCLRFSRINDAIAKIMDKYPQYQLGMKPLTRISNSKKALIFEGFAQQNGKGTAYAKAMWQAFLCEGQNIGSPSVIKEIAAGVGLDPSGFEDYVSDPQNLAAFDALQTQVKTAGRTNIPNFTVNGAYELRGFVSETEWAALFDKISVS